MASGWATARVAPTRASSPWLFGAVAWRGLHYGCDACRRPRLSSPTLVVAHACRRPRYRARRARRRPCRFPDGLVRVGTGRDKGVGRHLVRRKRSRAEFGMGDREGRPYAGLVAGLFGAVGATLVVAHACRRPRLSSPTLSRPQGAPSPMPVSRWPRSGRYGTPQGRGTPSRTKETKPCRIRDGRPRGSPLRGPRRRVVRGRRGDACRRPRLPSPTLSRPQGAPSPMRRA